MLSFLGRFVVGCLAAVVQLLCLVAIMETLKWAGLDRVPPAVLVLFVVCFYGVGCALEGKESKRENDEGA